jgi:hypothetical protein
MNRTLALALLCGCASAPSGTLVDGPVLAQTDAPLADIDARPGPIDARPSPIDARSFNLDAPQAIDARPNAPDAQACGPCPTGYHCGSANGIPVCRNDGSGIPLFAHVFVIMMENLSFSELTEPDNVQQSPFLQGLMTSAAYGTNYHGVAHPSLPNYIALTSGDTHGIECDCSPGGDGSCGTFTCNTIIHSCSCPQGGAHLGDQLEAAGRSWRAYGESMGRGTPCRMDTAGDYAARHLPFVYYTNLQADAARCASHVVDYSYFAEEPAVPSFVFIAPNLTDDMHDPVVGHSPNIANGDTWLGQTGVPAITALDAYTGGGLIVIVWDEDDYSGIFADDDPIPIFVLSPYAKTGYVSGAHADHYSLLATFEDGLGLPRLGHAAQATPLSDYFPDR